MNAAADKKARATKAKTMVYGIGGTGVSVARFLARQGIDACFVDTRTKPPGLDELREIAPDAGMALGTNHDSLLKGISRLIVSPGISDQDRFVVTARDAGIDVVSDIQLFVENTETDFVAVTGSNGKSTVTTLLGLMCDAAGKAALPGGNLGEPALDLLAGDAPELYILELSSFQLQRTRDLPARVAVLLNISPDHLDWHVDEAEYRRAKYRVFDQAENVVYNRADASTLEHIPADVSRISFGLDVPETGQYGVITDDGVEFLARGEQPLLGCDDIAMVGRHNRANALAAMAVGELIGLDAAPMLQVLNEFPGLPHRMQYLATIAGVDYINDSKATNVGAAIASVRSIDTPVVLLAGGQGKGGDFDALAGGVVDGLRAIVVFGEDAALIADAFKHRAPMYLVSNLDAAVDKARELACAGDTVLLAPACASFDQFPNYMARGDAFCDAVRGYGQ